MIVIRQCSSLTQWQPTVSIWLVMAHRQQHNLWHKDILNKLFLRMQFQACIHPWLWGQDPCQCRPQHFYKFRDQIFSLVPKNQLHLNRTFCNSRSLWFLQCQGIVNLATFLQSIKLPLNKHSHSNSNNNSCSHHLRPVPLRQIRPRPRLRGQRHH